MAKRSLEIDMCAGSQLRDSQGEMLSIDGADISALTSGNGRINDNHGKGFSNSIGRVTGAKKIYSEADCENDRHKYYWDKMKSPYIYVSGRLYNDEDHPNARAAAAILKSIHKEDAPLKLKASVEGGIIKRGERDKSLLAGTKIHSIALTFTPANKATLVEPLSLEKTCSSAEDEALIKSVAHLAQENVPNFIDITNALRMHKIEENVLKITELSKRLRAPVGPLPEKPRFFNNHEGVIPKDHPDRQKAVDHVNELHRSGHRSAAIKLFERHISGENVNKHELEKALMAGYGGAGAPTNRTHGTVLQTESLADGKKDFKRITCDECGFDQIMAKSQLKCRKCGGSFSFEKMCSSFSRIK